MLLKTRPCAMQAWAQAFSLSVCMHTPLHTLTHRQHTRLQSNSRVCVPAACASHKDSSSSAGREDPLPLGKLSEEQAAAVTDPNDACYVKAGPGTGKTRVITARIQHLLENGAAQDSILAFTFTRKAATELQERLENMYGKNGPRIYATTFHSFCLRFLVENVHGMAELGIPLSSDFMVFDDADSKDVLQMILEEQKLKPAQGLGFLRKSRDVETYVSSLSFAFNVIKNLVPTSVGSDMLPVFDKALRDNKITLNYKLSVFKDPLRLATLFSLYQEACVANDAGDYADLISYSVALLLKPHIQEHSHKFSHILVDEFQDTNKPQFTLVSLLKGESGSLFVVGDEDQQIYSWRGTDALKMGENFRTQWPHRSLRSLSGNYRSGQNHLDSASALLSTSGAPDGHVTLDALLGHAGSVHHVSISGGGNYGEAEGQAVAQIVAGEIAQGTPLSEIACLFRTNREALHLSKHLGLKGIPHCVVGKDAFWKDKGVKVAMSFLCLIAKPVPTPGVFSLDLWRILTMPVCGDFGQQKAFALQTGVCQVQGRIGLNQLLFGDLLEVFMEGTELVKLVDHVAQTAQLYSSKFKEEHRAHMDATLAGVQYMIPELTPNDLPGTSFEECQGINRLRCLFVLGRSAACFLHPKDALVLFLEVSGYRLDVQCPEEGKERPKKDHVFDTLLAAMQELPYKSQDTLQATNGPNISALCTFISDIKQLEGNNVDSDKNVRLMTIHTGKGTEYTCVILCGFYDRNIPLSKHAHQWEEEKRIVFVASTRVKERIFIIAPVPGQFTQRGKTMNPSPFTAELRELEAKQPGTIVFSNIPTDVDTE